MGAKIDTTLTLDTEDLREEIGNQLILDGDHEDVPYAYLAGIALEAMNDEDMDLDDVVIEYLRNTYAFDLREDELDEIEAMLLTARLEADR